MLKGHLDAIVLAAIEAGPAHGYAIIEAIKGRSGSTFDLPEGTVYPALHRLVKRGWLKAEWGISEANQRAKFYRLTAAGKAQLLRERDRWSQLVHAIGLVLNPAPREK